MKVGDVFVRMALDNRGYRRSMDREEGYTRQRAMTLGTVFSKGFSGSQPTYEELKPYYGDHPRVPP